MSLDIIALLLTVLSLGIALLGLREYAEGAFQRRRLASRSALEDVERRGNRPLAQLDTLVRRTDLGKKLEGRLETSGVRIRPSVFVVLMAVAAVVAIVFVWYALAPVLSVAAAAGVVAAFLAYLNRQEERRKEAFTAQLPELARVLSNATQAGLALPTAVDMAADELDDPAGAELRTAARSMHLGQSFESAVSDLRERMPSREIGVLISTLLVSSRSGGALVTALRSISQTLESRKETRREMLTILGETTATSWALLVMGVGSLFMLNFMQPGTVRTMTESGWGILVLGIGLALFVIGFFAVRRMSKIEF
ncbi:tight adherence protein B [Lipingzhangella halophila]|uniref:Tight adherence protein B n=1 Tax=Lipingzhangella halophila TaxID=1783352 RepID=A0A7W7RDV3_9ACTN|nr:type II secretion system F family protein [Lipingzhangella halophila]MBB4930145.1 tight adherence protein B [Lipingzhangella halophila]